MVRLEIEKRQCEDSKIKKISILKGMQVYHNYIRPHEGLEGKTPAEACGIELKGGE